MAISGIQSTDNMRSFVEANPNKLAHRSYLRQEVENKDKTRKFNRNINAAFKSLPIVAAASTFALTKNAKLSAKSGAAWGIAVAMPWLVSKINNTAVKSSPKVRKAEKQHAGLTAAGLIATSYAAIEGGLRGFNKLAKMPAVNNAFDTAVKTVKDTAAGLTKNIKVPTKVSGAIEGARGFVKNAIPEAVKTFVKKPTVESIIAGGKNIAKKGIANAPALIGFTALGAIIGKAVSDSAKYSKIKSDVKTAQFETAKNLVNIYGDENDQLKAENDDLKAQLADATAPAAEPDDSDEDA